MSTHEPRPAGSDEPRLTPAQIETFKMITSPHKFSGPGLYEDGLQAGWPNRPEAALI